MHWQVHPAPQSVKEAMLQTGLDGPGVQTSIDKLPGGDHHSFSRPAAFKQLDCNLFVHGIESGNSNPHEQEERILSCESVDKKHQDPHKDGQDF